MLITIRLKRVNSDEKLCDFFTAVWISFKVQRPWDRMWHVITFFIFVAKGNVKTSQCVNSLCESEGKYRWTLRNRYKKDYSLAWEYHLEIFGNVANKKYGWHGGIISPVKTTKFHLFICSLTLRHRKIYIYLLDSRLLTENHQLFQKKIHTRRAFS